MWGFPVGLGAEAVKRAWANLISFGTEICEQEATMTATATIKDRPADPSIEKLTPRRRNRTFALVVVLGYVLISVAAFWPVMPWSSTRIFGTGGDSILAMWFLAWVPHALAHGLNPLFSNAIFVPTGVNLAQNTEAPLLGLLTAPFALFLGPVARANLLMVLAMPASATAAFFVLRKWRVWGPAAALGGLIYGFSPYAVGQGLGHLVLIFLPFPPLIAMTVVSIVQQQGSPRRLGIQLGLLVSAQFLCEMEVMTTVAILTAWALICFVVRYPKRAASIARSSLKSFGIAFALAAVLLAYPIWMLLAGPQHYNGTAQSVVNPYYNDILSFIAPGPLQRSSLGLRSIGVVVSNPSELGGFIGLPLLIVAAVLVWRSRKSPRMQLTVATLLGAAILSLGPHLAVAGHLTRIPMPFIVFSHLPLLDNILPVRMSMEVDACIGVVIAFGLDDLRRAPARAHHRDESFGRARIAVVLTAVTLVVLVISQLPLWPYASEPVRSLPAAISSAIPSGDPIAVTYPYALPVSTQPMLWQAQDGFSFRLLGGYSEHPDPDGAPTGFPNAMNPPGLDLFLEGQQAYSVYLPHVAITPQLLASARAGLINNDVRLVIVDNQVKGAGPVLVLFGQILGKPTVSSGSFTLWSSRGGAF